MANRLRWQRYKVDVTLIPLPDSPIYGKGRKIQTCSVIGLDDHMAGLLACKIAEDYFPDYVAHMFHVKEREELNGDKRVQIPVRGNETNQTDI